MGASQDFRKRVAAGAIVAGALVAVGALLLFVARPAPADRPDPADAEQPSPASPEVASPVGEGSAVPVGHSQDEHGAASAAVAYATAPQRWLYFTDDEITAAISQIATPVAAPRLTDEVVADVRMARDQLGTSPGRVWWLVRPLAWRVERYSTTEATVSVWTVTILSAQEVAAPQSEWITVSIELAWVDGDWRVDAVRDTPGPTPVNGPKDQPWDALPFDDALDGFTRMDGEPVR